MAKMFEELNSPLKGKVEKQPTQKIIKSILQCNCQCFCYQKSFPKGSYVGKKHSGRYGLID
jgi:hypothetical protein